MVAPRRRCSAAAVAIACITFLSLLLQTVLSSVQYEVHYEIDHDSHCYTQGLMFYQGYLYETCGQYGQSSVRKVDPKTGQVLRSRMFGREIFAEGLAIKDDKMFILTWTNKVMITLDVATFGLLGKFAYNTHNGEGWGIAIDDTTNTMIVSDGTDRLSLFKVPEVFAPLEQGDRKSKITIAGTPFAPVQQPQGGSIPYLEKIREVVVVDPSTGESINRINELEWTPGGYIYANLWYLDDVVKIDVATGRVVQKLNLKKLYPPRRRAPTADCLNGIAYDPTDNSLLLTGKYWPKYFTITVTGDAGENLIATGSPKNNKGKHDINNKGEDRRPEELRHA